VPRKRAYKTIHVACGQIVCRPGDIKHNLGQIGDMAARASSAGARIILFGEGAVTGYVFTEEVRATALSSEGKEAKRLMRIAKKNDIVIAAGTLERSEAGLHVSNFVAFPDDKLLVQRKHKIPPKDEAAGVIPGEEKRIVFQVDGVKFAICICADSSIPDIRNKLARQGCQVMFLSTAGGAGREYMCHAEDLEVPQKRKEYLDSMEKVCFVGEAIENCIKHRMAVCATNLAGDDGVSNYHPGHSCIIDSTGRLVALIPGEYVVEYLRPQLIHGEIVVQRPRTSAE